MFDRKGVFTMNWTLAKAANRINSRLLRFSELCACLHHQLSEGKYLRICKGVFQFFLSLTHKSQCLNPGLFLEFVKAHHLCLAFSIMTSILLDSLIGEMFKESENSASQNGIRFVRDTRMNYLFHSTFFRSLKAKFLCYISTT